MLQNSTSVTYHVLTLRSPMVSWRSFSENVTRSVAIHRHSSWWRSCFKRYANSFCVSLKSYHENKADCNSDTLILNLQKKKWFYCKYNTIFIIWAPSFPSKIFSSFTTDHLPVLLWCELRFNVEQFFLEFTHAYSRIRLGIFLNSTLYSNQSTSLLHELHFASLHNRKVTCKIAHIKRITTRFTLCSLPL